jgi:hypothetical protein
MSDASVAINASDIFSLNSNFKTQSSGTSKETSNITVLDSNGNVTCETNIADITNYTQSATYCGSDFHAHLGTLLTQFGNVQGGKLVTGLTINMSAAEYVSIDIEGHNHDSNAHSSGTSIGYADVSDFLPHGTGESFSSWNGFGVPDFGIVTGSNASPASATVTFSMSHVDQTDHAGAHLVGKNITPRCELSMSFSGVPTSQTLAAIQGNMQANDNNMLDAVADSTDANDGNTEFDSFSFVAHAHTDLAS